VALPGGLEPPERRDPLDLLGRLDLSDPLAPKGRQALPENADRLV
jgi:hypothetical protein